MKPMPQEPVPSESDSLDLGDVNGSFQKKQNVVIGLLIGILVAILIVAIIIVHKQIDIRNRITNLEDEAEISQEQDQKFSDIGVSVDDLDTRLGRVDAQLQSVDDQLVSLDEQVQKNAGIANDNADIISKNTAAFNDHFNALR